MENASKALIIAGAILLSILLISLGIMVFSQANGVINNNAMSELEISQFNQKFTQYQGTRVRGTTVQAMLQPILSNNVSADSDDRKVKVYFGGNENKDEGTVLLDNSGINSDNVSTKIKTGSIYNVACEYGDGAGNKGLVTRIRVTDAS